MAFMKDYTEAYGDTTDVIKPRNIRLTSTKPVAKTDYLLFLDFTNVYHEHSGDIPRRNPFLDSLGLHRLIENRDFWAHSD